LNVHAVNDVRQTEIHTAEPLVPESSAFDFDLAIEKLNVTSPGIDLISAELFKAGGRTIRYEIHKFLLLFGKRRICMRSGRSRTL
jgi:hypothetical protein